MPRPLRSRSTSSSGFTIVEVLAVVIIILILASFIVPNYSTWINRAQEVKCMANMRAIHVGLLAYLNDHQEIWPQGPSPKEESAWAKFWIETVEPYGVMAKTWQCPTMAGQFKRGERAPLDGGAIHYSPTMFDAQPNTAKRLSTYPLNQPWLIERADAHAQGTLIVFGDGTIKSFNQVLAEQGMR
jgi:prepilin-type N-terminal cleavage/methylation domain-containing protein